MSFFSRFALFIGLCFSLGTAQAVTVTDQQGTFTLDTAPERVVVLELSFVDALAVVDVSPVGVADDNDAERILPEVRQRISAWKSVGTRSQPSLEAIAALKPDLIIADSSRHGGIYAALKGIAPTLMLKSRNETYNENLESAAIIGKVLGKDALMQQRLAEHHQRMQAFSSQLPKGTQVVFGTSREQQFNLHTRDSYTGSVLTSLGLIVPEPVNQQALANISFEQLLAINPDWLIVAHYRQESIVRAWQKDPLWQMMKAAQKNQIAAVDANVWARMRGVFAAEHIGHDVVQILHHQAPATAP
ncbi:ABC transporter substrate-binding protein [Rahnella sp. Lac-M11]|jgi:ABC-type Fe3+-citrate transport system substrate-binding protein|uniref:ABC transporter substrate-binding protein n=1 Tax=Rahnella contaminans TaxID=2703882 RepID=A0A6M2B5J7_9GAMM|nr:MULTISPECIES: Fe(3+) dicitrate ABC transporter substrate-binding protein FecB [Rahnella]MBU9821227.1 Fe(3+) dicitrate ABC transporter substrate-binding protein FecB [Rahnella sp. BCC 1045]NGX88606.1 ABC transporter substrate-binding protein [Rahnella contaminans]